MEETLWHLEDQWKLSTHKAIIIFSSTCLLVFIIVLCLLLAMWRSKHSKSRGTIHQEPPPPMGRRSTVAGVLMGTARWSEVSKWDREAPTALLVKQDNENEVGWGSHSSTSAVWQKPILMGEKCELPSFSGLILYDQRGLPLDPRFEQEATHIQEESPAPVRTTLKDFL